MLHLNFNVCSAFLHVMTAPMPVTVCHAQDCCFWTIWVSVS